MDDGLEPSARAHALGFLRQSSGVEDVRVDDGVLRDILFSLSEGKVTPGKAPTWIDDLLRGLRGPVPELPPVRLCLSHDVDFTTSRDPGLKLIRRLTRALLGDGPKGRGLKTVLGSLFRLLTAPASRERYGDYMDWLRLEERFGFRSTFFFLPYPDKHPHVLDGDYRFSDRVRFDNREIRVSDMMREIASAGWEVGLHGTINSASRGGMLVRQKQSIEEAIGREVLSVRQHFLNRVPGLTHRLQEQAGLRVDSTIGHTRSIGLKAGTSHPFQLWDAGEQRALRLVELPLIAMDTPLLVSGFTNNGPEAAVEILKRIGHSIAASGGVFTLNWHPHNLPVPQLQEIYVELLSWCRDRHSVAFRTDSFAAAPIQQV